MTEPKVIFEDNDILVLEKPAGWVVNRVESSDGPIVAKWVIDYLKINQSIPYKTHETHQTHDYRNNYHDQNIPDLSDAPDFPDVEQEFIERSGIVHRIDKETSGILLVAKNITSFENLLKQFAERVISKTYLALAHGKTDPAGEVEAAVGRLPWSHDRFGVLADGKSAATTYKTLNYYQVAGTDKSRDQYHGICSLLELHPRTGRTHQIRVHLKSISHPIVADEFYAGRKTAREDRKWCPRLFLHAAHIGFNHPTNGAWIEFESNLPGDLSASLNQLMKITA